MNYNTLCLKLSSCLHSSTLTSSLSSVLFTFLSASLSHASPPLCLPSQSFPSLFSPPIFHLPSPLNHSFSSPPFILTPSLSIYLFYSLSPLFLLLRPPLLLFTPSPLLASPPPSSSLLPRSISSQTHTHLALPFIASGGWRATVSFNPSQCHLQTLTVTQRLHRCLTIKAVALSKAGRGVITAAARQIEPCLI